MKDLIDGIRDLVASINVKSDICRLGPLPRIKPLAGILILIKLGGTKDSSHITLNWKHSMLYGCEKDRIRPVKQEQEHKMLFKPDSISLPAIILKPSRKLSKNRSHSHLSNFG